MPTTTIASNSNNDYSKDIKFLLFVVTSMVLALGAYLAHVYGWVTFGKPDYITVTGTSRNLQSNQVATFNAGVTVLNPDKAEAVRMMNEKAAGIMNAIKEFGIPEEDLRTSNVSVFQEQSWDAASQQTVFGDWRATTSLEIKLKDVSRSTELSDLLASLETTDVFGPNFTIDVADVDEGTLLSMAYEDAKAKAYVAAQTSGRTLGKVTHFVEGVPSSAQPMFFREGMGGGGAPLAPGSTEVSKTVTVTFLLR